jgi:nitroimidazol reductase NimA-like FMN-containing flavoprotein (pyridoxamine 5'-phosphate oxidase superfamily)
MTDGGSRQMEALSGVECYRLLATEQVGRLGVDVGRYPLIFPVNYHSTMTRSSCGPGPTRR